MFRFTFPWTNKSTAVPSEVPKSFVAAEKNQLLRFSMEDTVADFVDIDYKKMTYAEVASLSRNKEQSSLLTRARTKRKPPVKSRFRSEDLDAESMDEIQEKTKVNNHFMKKVHKTSDRRKK